MSKRPPILVPYERKVLRSFVDATVKPSHGAAYNQACETLRGFGYLTREGRVTDAGRAAIERPDDDRLPTASPVRAPLDHVPVYPTADPRLPTADPLYRAFAAMLLASIALLGGALLGKCWPW